MLPGLSAPIGGLASALPLTYVGSTVDTTSQANYTFSNVNIGGPGLIVVFVSARTGTSTTISNVSIGGTSATAAIKVTNSYPVGLFYRRITSGGTATITVNMSASVTNCAITVYRLVGNTSDTPFHTASSTVDLNSVTVSLNIPASGVAIAGGQLATVTTVTWTNLTEDVETTQGSGSSSTASAKYLAAQTGRSITAAASAKIQNLVAASWS